MGNLVLLVQEGCGFQPRGVSTQVYSFHPRHGPLCLSGTAEIPLAGTGSVLHRLFAVMLWSVCVCSVFAVVQCACIMKCACVRWPGRPRLS